MFENGINEGKLFSEIDAASQEALAKDVRQMQEIVREIHEKFEAF